MLRASASSIHRIGALRRMVATFNKTPIVISNRWREISQTLPATL